MKPDYYDNIRHDVIRLIPDVRIDRILEVGGGTFSTLRVLKKKYNADCWGVDIVGVKQSEIKVIKGSIENAATVSSLGDQQFDLIMANDVLEHLVDTERVLSVFNNLLVSGGRIAVSVPNARQLRFSYNVLFRGTFPRNDSGMFDRTHLRWFCKRDIERIILGSGFAIETSTNVGRFVARGLGKTIFGQLLGLQTVIIARKL